MDAYQVTIGSLSCLTYFKTFMYHILKAVAQSCLVKKVFLKISQNSQENTCASLFLNKVTTLLKKRRWHKCFSVNFCEIFENTIFYRIPMVAASENG